MASACSTSSGSSVGSSHGYVEVKAIGKGSFGTATLVRNSDGRLCVMKTMCIGRLDRIQRKAAAAEVMVLASLKHPYIVRYHESFLDNNSLAIVMDYAEGGDLERRITTARMKQTPFPESQVLRWFTQACLGLKYLHGRNILHRDIKPGNLFLTKTEQLRIGDFGIAKVLSDKGVMTDKAVNGTPYYLSPEVCLEALYSFASDMWAMGCVLYELCALKVPFDAGNMKGLVQRITREPSPALPASYSRELNLIVRQLLERNHQQRPDTTELIQGRLMQGQIARMLSEEKASQSPEVQDLSTRTDNSAAEVCRPASRCERTLRQSGSAALLQCGRPASRQQLAGLEAAFPPATTGAWAGAAGLARASSAASARASTPGASPGFGLQAQGISVRDRTDSRTRLQTPPHQNASVWPTRPATPSDFVQKRRSVSTGTTRRPLQRCGGPVADSSSRGPVVLSFGA